MWTLILAASLVLGGLSFGCLLVAAGSAVEDAVAAARTNPFLFCEGEAQALQARLAPAPPPEAASGGSA